MSLLKSIAKIRRNKFFHQDRIAMRIADRYGMTYDYKVARRHHLTPIEALEDWDLLTEEALKEIEAYKPSNR